MKFSVHVILLGIFVWSFVDAAPRKSRQLTQVPLKFQDVIGGSIFPQRSFNGTWMTGSEFLYRNSQGDYNIYNVVDNSHRLFLARADLSGWTGASYTFSGDYTKVLVRYAVRSIFRHSTVAKFAVYNIEDQTSVDVSNTDELNVCVWSPASSNTLVFVKDNDVYTKNLNPGGTETRLTFDGVPGVVYNGVPDWVYEEEVLGSGAALWISPTGVRMAIASFDDNEVNEFMYFMYGRPGNEADQYFQEIQLRYPKAGTTNPRVTLRVNNFADPSTWRTLPTPVDIVSDDHILGTVTWFDDERLLALWLNRRQNIATLQSCVISTETCTELMRFNEPNGWVPISTPRCYSSANICLMIANSDGWFKVWKYDFTQQQSSVVTPDAYTVSSIYGYDQVNDNLYYLAVPGSNPERRHVFRDSTCLTCDSKGPEGIDCTYGGASFSRDFSYYAQTCSGPTPSYTYLTRTTDNTRIFTWEENLATRENVTKVALPQIRYLKVPVAGGFEASVRLRMPGDLNFPEGNGQKYPMIVYVYGGPNSARVTDSFGVGFGDFMVSGHGVIEAQIDGRGTANQGTNYLFTLNNHLGTVEIEDQIAVTKYLQDRYDFIDADRTGIWGWSYGGYATAMALAKDTGRVFQCGISVAPVISWIYYDSIYTERFMGLPNATYNDAGYNASDITRNIEEFKHHDFLLIHGNADDNVHFQNSMVLSRVLQQANIMFEQMSYPDEAHGLNGVSRHLYHLMESFWMQCLGIEE